MINKRGQVTIFIIIAIIIVGAVAAFFALRDSLNIGGIPASVEPIHTNILSCLEETTEEGLDYLALQGGYYEVPKAISISYFTEDIPYYYLNSKKYIPSIEIVEEELENYIHNYLSNCLEFDSFREQGYEVNEGDLLVSVNIREDKIRTKLDYPLTITKGESTKRLREFEILTDSNLERLLEVSEEVVDSYSKKPGFVCLTCIEEISVNNEVQIISAPFSKILTDEEAIFFSISSYEDELNWKFAVEI